MRKIVLLAFACCLPLCLAGSVRSDDQDDLKMVIDKGIKAAGGEEKLSKFKAGTCKIKGRILEGDKGGTFTFDAFLQGLEQVKVEGTLDVQGMQMKVAFVVNGDQGWAKFMDTVEDAPKEVHTALKDVIRAFRYVHALTLLKDKSATLSSLGEANIDGKTALGLKVACKDQRDINVFLDKATGLPLKAEFNISKGGQEETVEFTFSDYKEFNGAKHFTKVALKQGGKPIFEADLSEFKWVDMIEANVFEKP
jgi:hypothetical protein